MSVSLKNKQVVIVCDGEPMELWEKCLLLHMVRAGVATNPNCVLVMMTGASHEDADEACDEAIRRLKGARISFSGLPTTGDTHEFRHGHKDIIQ